MIIKSFPSFDCLKSESAGIDYYFDDAIGVYVFCEGTDSNLSAANYARIAIEQCIRENLELIQRYNRTSDYETLCSLENVLLKTINTVNFKTHEENFSGNYNQKRSHTSAKVVIVLNGYCLSIHVGSGTIYQFNENFRDFLVRPHTVYESSPIHSSSEVISKNERAEVKNCLGQGPVLQVDHLKFQISDEVIIIALSSAANTILYDSKFHEAISQKKGSTPEEISRWILMNFKPKEGRFDFVVITATTDHAKITADKIKNEIKIIASLKLFKTIENDSTALKSVHGLARFKEYQPGEYLYTEKQTDLCIFIIISGDVEVSKFNKKTQKQRFLLTVKDGGLLGEVTVFSRATHYVATAKVLKPTRCMVITKENLLNIINRDSRFGLPFMFNIAEILAGKGIELSDLVELYFKPS